MKIVIIGASGTVGRAVTETLSRKHEVIRVGRTQGITGRYHLAGECRGIVRKSRSGRCDRFRHRQSVLWTAVDNDRPGL